MRKIVSLAGLCAIFYLAATAGLANAASPSKSGTGTIVIVFKDGHRQSFNLADIERVEFPSSGLASSDEGVNPSLPSRARYFGKWEAGDGNGGTFYISLYENGDAKRTIGDVHGKWAYVNGEALITWDDGKLDAIRKVGSRFRKFAYMEGNSFTDKPANVTDAHNTTPHPI
jgi:hypothetical protein